MAYVARHLKWPLRLMLVGVFNLAGCLKSGDLISAEGVGPANEGNFDGCLAAEALDGFSIKIDYEFPPSASEVKVLRNGVTVFSSGEPRNGTFVDVNLQEGVNYRYSCSAIFDDEELVGRKRHDVKTISTNAPEFLGISKLTAQPGGTSLRVEWRFPGSNGPRAEYFLVYATYGLEVNWNSSPTRVGPFSTHVVINNLGDEIPYSVGVRACSEQNVCDSNTQKLTVNTLNSGSPNASSVTDIIVRDGTAEVIAPWSPSKGGTAKRELFVKIDSGNTLASRPTQLSEYTNSGVVENISAPYASIPDSLFYGGMEEAKTYWFVVRETDPSGATSSFDPATARAFYVSDLTRPTFSWVNPSPKLALGPNTGSQIKVSFIPEVAQSGISDVNGTYEYAIFLTSKPFGSSVSAGNPCIDEYNNGVGVEATQNRFRYSGGLSSYDPSLHSFYQVQPNVQKDVILDTQNFGLGPLSQRTTYSVCVKAYDESGNSSPNTASASITTHDTVAPTFGGLKEIGVEDGKIVLRWDPSPSTDLKNYRVDLVVERITNGIYAKEREITFNPSVSSISGTILEIENGDSLINGYTFESGDRISAWIDLCDTAGDIPGGISNCSNSRPAVPGTGEYFLTWPNVTLNDTVNPTLDYVGLIPNTVSNKYVLNWSMSDNSPPLRDESSGIGGWELWVCEGNNSVPADDCYKSLEGTTPGWTASGGRFRYPEHFVDSNNDGRWELETQVNLNDSARRYYKVFAFDGANRSLPVLRQNYNDPPTISGLSRNVNWENAADIQSTESYLQGGPSLTITGTNFLVDPNDSSKKAAVEIGGSPCENVSINSAGTQITCIPPKMGEPGKVSIKVSNYDGQFVLRSETDSQAFRYRSFCELSQEKNPSSPFASSVGNLVAGDGSTPSAPALVCNQTHLENIPPDSSFHVKLMDNIDMGGGWNEVWDNATPSNFSGLIGGYDNSNATGFRGTIDGNGYAIRNWVKQLGHTFNVSANLGVGFISECLDCEVKNIAFENIYLKIRTGDGVVNYNINRGHGVVAGAARLGENKFKNIRLKNVILDGRNSDVSVYSVRNPLNMGLLIGRQESPRTTIQDILVDESFVYGRTNSGDAANNQPFMDPTDAHFSLLVGRGDLLTIRGVRVSKSSVVATIGIGTLVGYLEGSSNDPNIIEDNSVTDVELVSKANGSNYYGLGGLVGRMGNASNTSSIQRNHVDVDLTHLGSAQMEYVGGLIGFLDGSLEHTITVPELGNFIRDNFVFSKLYGNPWDTSKTSYVIGLLGGGSAPSGGVNKNAVYEMSSNLFGLKGEDALQVLDDPLVANDNPTQRSYLTCNNPSPNFFSVLLSSSGSPFNFSSSPVSRGTIGVCQVDQLTSQDDLSDPATYAGWNIENPTSNSTWVIPKTQTFDIENVIYGFPSYMHPALDGTSPMRCPDNFLEIRGRVLASGTYVKSFCISKYEISSNNFNKAGLVPQTGITEAQARDTCRSLRKPDDTSNFSQSAQFDIPSMNQMNLVRETILGISKNKKLDIVNNGLALSPLEAPIASSTVDSEACRGTQSACFETDENWTNKRTHLLEQNQVIWDFDYDPTVASNAKEHVQGANLPANSQTGIRCVFNP